MPATGYQQHPPLYAQTAAGKLFHASITTATAIPIFATNATPNFLLFNPSGSNMAAVLTRCNIGFVAGTSVASTIGYAYLSPAGSAMAGTAAPISTYTAGPAIQSGIVGGKYTGNLTFASAATIGGVVSALTMLKWANLSAGVVTATSTAAAFNMWEDFDGSIIIPPNTAFCLISQPALVTTMQITVSGYEVPFPLVP